MSPLPRPADPDDPAVLRRRIEQLEQALATNRRISVAIGMLMVRRGCDYDAAKSALWSASSRRNVKIRELADEVIVHGDLVSDGAARATSRGVVVDGWAAARAGCWDGPCGEDASGALVPAEVLGGPQLEDGSA